MAKSEKSRIEERERSVKDRIFLALKDWRDDDNNRIARDIDRCDELTNSLFNHLKAEGVLHLEDDD